MTSTHTPILLERGHKMIRHFMPLVINSWKTLDVDNIEPEKHIKICINSVLKNFENEENPVLL